MIIKYTKAEIKRLTAIKERYKSTAAKFPRTEEAPTEEMLELFLPLWDQMNAIREEWDQTVEDIATQRLARLSNPDTIAKKAREAVQDAIAYEYISKLETWFTRPCLMPDLEARQPSPDGNYYATVYGGNPAIDIGAPNYWDNAELIEEAQRSDLYSNPKTLKQWIIEQVIPSYLKKLSDALQLKNLNRYDTPEFLEQVRQSELFQNYDNQQFYTTPDSLKEWITEYVIPPYLQKLEKHPKHRRRLLTYVNTAIARAPHVKANPYEEVSPTQESPPPLGRGLFFPSPYIGRASRAMLTTGKETYNYVHDTREAIHGNDRIYIEKASEIDKTLGKGAYDLFNYVNKAWYERGEDNRDNHVTISITDYCRHLGKKIDERPTTNEEELQRERKRIENIKTKTKREALADITALSSYQIEWKDKAGRHSYSLLGGYTSKGDLVDVTYNARFYEVIKNARATKYNSILAPLLDGRNPSAIALQEAMIEHYFMYPNRSTGTYNRLKVETLLKNTAIDPTQSERRRNWRRNIKGKLEETLNQITEGTGQPLLTKWSYTTDEAPATLEEYLAMTVTYEVEGDPDGHNENYLAWKDSKKKHPKPERSRTKRKYTKKS